MSENTESEVEATEATTDSAETPDASAESTTPGQLAPEDLKVGELVELAELGAGARSQDPGVPDAEPVDPVEAEED